MPDSMTFEEAEKAASLAYENITGPAARIRDQAIESARSNKKLTRLARDAAQVAAWRAYEEATAPAWATYEKAMAPWRRPSPASS